MDAAVSGGGVIAEVINRTTDVLATARVMQAGQRTDLRAQAARFRDLRNYGLHPVGPVDTAREDAFTEAGAASLFMTSRRYFLQLEEARVGIANRGGGPPLSGT